MYHVILRGNHQQAIFNCEADYREFEGLLARAISRYAVRVHAYCWMTNHVHLAMQVADAPLGRTVQALASAYARHKQRRVPTTGHLFERRYRATVVDTDAYLLTLLRYIHRNPVDARLVSDPAEYKWSSHRAYLGQTRPDWLTVEPTLAMFGDSSVNAVTAYRRFVLEDRSEEMVDCDPPGRAWDATFEVQVQQPESLSLEQVVLAVSAELGVDPALLESGCRERKLVRARLEIARRALASGVACLSAVAARLGRSPSTLSEQLNRLHAPRFGSSDGVGQTETVTPAP
jgi:REP element-mobilizing transposase RayT